ncbi:MAG: D-alanine--D-alanine ligase [Planctomycetes bacterium]|nr:D-alanine--D-alanine ligase [Planctomycetota bacterium]
MRVGITYDLRADYLAEGYGDEETAEFDRPDTIEGIEEALRALGHEPDRIGRATALVKRLAAGDRWDLVFNIAEGLHGYGREALVPALLEAYAIPYTFSDPLVLSVALHKGIAKRVVRDLGIPTPDFAVVEDLADVDRIRMPFPVFAKPVAEGTGKGSAADSKARDRERLRATCARLLSTFRQPVLVEEFLPGREFTAGIVGTGPTAEVIGVIEVVLLEGKAEPDAYSYENKAKYEDRVAYRLADDAEAREAGRVALAAWRGLGCRDAGRADIRSDARGQPSFIEVNPLAGLNPVHSDLPIICGLVGIPFRELLRRIVESALARINEAPAPPPRASARRT